MRVYTASEVRAFDRRAIDDFAVPGIRLMHRAGRAVFAALRERWPDACRLSIVCGAGNNAGDGYVVAGLARDAGLDVQLVQVGDPARLSDDAKAARRFAECRLGIIQGARDDWRIDGDVVVDALLGTGAKGEVRPPFRKAIERINQAGKPVLALDLPSGIDADSGGLLTPVPVHAELTVTFVAAKLGLATGDAVDCVGELIVADLQLPDAVFDRPGIAVLDGASLAGLRRRRSAHKGDFGRLLIVGGEADMGGAVLLAGEAALRSGAGVVVIATRAVHRAAVLARRPELMCAAVESPGDIEDLAERAQAIVVGPGLGGTSWGRQLLDFCIAAGKPLVVDADGLNNLADGDGLQRLPPGAVVTPHVGEAARLLGRDAAWIRRSRPQAATALSEHGAVAVLKGAGTLVASGGRLRSICLLGNPGMATAGSGDVLAGIVGALLARGLAPEDAAELGVWLHARAGDEAERRGKASLLAGDIVESLRLTP